MTIRHAARPLALVVGADRPRGQEIADRLYADGFDVVTDETEALARIDAGQLLEALVVNSPVVRSALRFRDLTEQDFQMVLGPQLYDLVSAGQFVAVNMQGGGAIVQVTATSHLGSWDGVHNAAGAAAAIAMARSMSLELATRGIRVNSLAPDTVDATDDSPADAGDVAAAVSWLIGSDSNLISGETTLLNRGQSLKMTQAACR